MSNRITMSLKWYDPSINKWKLGYKISMSRSEPLRILGVYNNQSLFFLSRLDHKNTFMVDLLSPFISPHLQQSIVMLHKRRNLGAGVLDSCIYAVSFLEYYFFKKMYLSFSVL